MCWPGDASCIQSCRLGANRLKIRRSFSGVDYGAHDRRLVSFMPWQSALVSIPFVKGGESEKNRFADLALHVKLPCIHPLSAHPLHSLVDEYAV